MAMQVGAAQEGEPLSEINTTPLIDVMLVLLIMIIVTLPPQRHAVKLDTPLPPPPDAPPPPDDLPDPESARRKLQDRGRACCPAGDPHRTAPARKVRSCRTRDGVRAA